MVKEEEYKKVVKKDNKKQEKNKPIKNSEQRER